MKIRLRNISNIELYSDFTADCNNCISQCESESVKIKCPLFNDERRIGTRSNDNGEVFCCSNSSDYKSSSRLFKSRQESLLLGLKEVGFIKEKLNLETQKLIHNLTKTNGHNIQELYAVVPQEILTQNIHEQLEYIQKIIAEEPEEAARAFLRIAKNNAAMKVEFSVINKLMEGESKLRKRRHPVKKVTLNLFHIFFQDFKDNDVYVNVEENSDYLIFDYEIIHVALYHLIHNATKYIRPNSTLNVSFTHDENDFYIVLEMSSLKIEEDEKHQLLEEGFSGGLARKLGKAGKGIGLGTTAKILALNEAELIIESNVTAKNSVKLKGINYEDNIFKIKFKNYAQQSV